MYRLYTVSEGRNRVGSIVVACRLLWQMSERLGIPDAEVCYS